MSSNEQPCPIWERAPSAQDIEESGRLCPSNRAGGRFVLKKDGAALLQRRLLTDRQRANLSYWIYHHNLRYRLFDKSPVGQPPVLDQAWVEGHRDRTPSTEDRVLTFLRELIRRNETGRQPRTVDGQLHLLQAAGGCRNDADRKDLDSYATEQKWLAPDSQIPPEARINLPARMYVEERTRELDQGRQGFVAMWFHESMDDAYAKGIEPAICKAGYEPMLIKNKEYLGDVTDEIVAEIRKSRFVVADFTTSKESGARGGVYFEAGFARGLGIDVIYTCHEDRMEEVHFDTNHFNHLTWKTPEDLRTKLQRRIEATLGRGPRNSSAEGSGSAGSSLNEAS